jgi:flagellar biosynthesis GTPase FlhF
MSGRSKNGGSENLAKEAKLSEVRGELDPPDDLALNEEEDAPKRRQGRDVIPDQRRPAGTDDSGSDSDDEDEPEPPPPLTGAQLQEMALRRLPESRVMSHEADLQYIYDKFQAPLPEPDNMDAVSVHFPRWVYEEEEVYEPGVDYNKLSAAEKGKWTKGRKVWMEALWKRRYETSFPVDATDDPKTPFTSKDEIFRRGKRLIEWAHKDEAFKDAYRAKWTAEHQEEIKAAVARAAARKAVKDATEKGGGGGAASAVSGAAASGSAVTGEKEGGAKGKEVKAGGEGGTGGGGEAAGGEVVEPPRRGVTALPRRDLMATVPVEDEQEGEKEKEKEESEHEQETVKPVGPVRGKGKTSLGPVPGHGKSPAMPPEMARQQQQYKEKIEKEEEKKRKREQSEAEKARKKEQSKQLAETARQERAQQAAEKKREREEAKVRREGAGKGKEGARGKEAPGGQGKEPASDDEVEGKGKGKGKTGSGFAYGKEGSTAGKDAVRASRRGRGRGKEENAVEEDDERAEADARRGGPADEKVESLTHAAIRRIARRAGCKRISNTAFEPMQNAGKRWMEKMLREAVAVMECYLPERRTVSSFDILYVLRRQNQRLFGFWERPGSKPLYNLPDD